MRPCPLSWLLNLCNRKVQMCLFIYLFIFIIFGCVGSSLLCTGFLQLWEVGATLRCGARASHHGGFSCCGAWALECAGFSRCGAWTQQLWLTGSRAQAQQLWRTGLVAPRHVGSSQTRARTRVPCIGRRILNHCASREALQMCLTFSTGCLFHKQ